MRLFSHLALCSALQMQWLQIEEQILDKIIAKKNRKNSN
jgi:hypothetical protein